MSFETYLKQQMLLKTVAIPRTPCQLRLYTGDLGETELSLGGPQLVQFAITSTAPVIATNTRAVYWRPGAYLPQGTLVTHVGVFDNSGVNLLAKRALQTPFVTPEFALPYFIIPLGAMEIGFV